MTDDEQPTSRWNRIDPIVLAGRRGRPYGVDGLMPGVTMNTTVMLSAGRWEVFCSVAGHYQSGQHQTSPSTAPCRPTCASRARWA